MVCRALDNGGGWTNARERMQWGENAREEKQGEVGGSRIFGGSNSCRKVLRAGPVPAIRPRVSPSPLLSSLPRLLFVPWLLQAKLRGLRGVVVAFISGRCLFSQSRTSLSN